MQLVEINGLGHMCIEPGLQAPSTILSATIAGHRNQSGLLKPAASTEGTSHFESRHFWQAQIAKDNVGLMLFCDRKAARPVIADQDIVTVQLKDKLERVSGIAIVFNH
jgi:hypothetical protein